MFLVHVSVVCLFQAFCVTLWTSYLHHLFTSFACTRMLSKSKQLYYHFLPSETHKYSNNKSIPNIKINGPGRARTTSYCSEQGWKHMVWHRYQARCSGTMWSISVSVLCRTLNLENHWEISILQPFLSPAYFVGGRGSLNQAMYIQPTVCLASRLPCPCDKCSQTALIASCFYMDVPTIQISYKSDIYLCVTFLNFYIDSWSSYLASEIAFSGLLLQEYSNQYLGQVWCWPLLPVRWGHGQLALLVV